MIRILFIELNTIDCRESRFARRLCSYSRIDFVYTALYALRQNIHANGKLNISARINPDQIMLSRPVRLSVRGMPVVKIRLLILDTPITFSPVLFVFTIITAASHKKVLFCYLIINPDNAQENCQGCYQRNPLKLPPNTLKRALCSSGADIDLQ